MSWIDIAGDESESTARRFLAGFGCGIVPWVCLAQETAGNALERTQEELEEARAQVIGEAGGGGILGGLREAGEAAAAPLSAGADLLMWGSVLVGMLIGLVLLGLFLWFVALPLMGFGGPRSVARSG